uniref:B30.2/SPRY domain-containing protein n=1 Tax=Maylandia zebra TaxID=106582 RepID=A0A3P9AW89_9CICH
MSGWVSDATSLGTSQTLQGLEAYLPLPPLPLPVADSLRHQCVGGSLCLGMGIRVHTGSLLGGRLSGPGDWTEIRVHPPSYEGTVVRAVAQLEEKLRKCMKKKLLEAELERVQQYAVDVTLDPDTASSRLILSADGKQVHCGDVRKNLPDTPQRFSPCPNVLGKQSLSSGRFYFEVQVKGKTAWDLGVASELVNRKGKVTLTPQDGFWSLGLRNRNEYRAFASPSVRLCLQSGPEKVGVFVDYEEGLVSFYDVDTAALIYSFTGCSFIQKLHPYFSPCLNDGGENSAPLINCPVNQIEHPLLDLYMVTILYVHQI